MAGQNLLTVRQIEALPEGFHSDGGNLYLRVRGNGRSWVFRYKVPKGAAWAAAGKPVELGLGSYPARGLKDARGVAEALRSEVANKRNPADYLNPPSAEPVKAKTFSDYATAYIEAHEAGWRNPKHRQQWRNTIIGPKDGEESDVQPYAKPIWTKAPGEITSAHIADLLEPIWRTKTETATRVRQRIETIIDYAFVKEGIDRRNPARWKGNLEHVLPDPRKAAKAAGKLKNHAAPPWADVPAIMASLRAKPAVTSALALRFSILTAARSMETRAMTWSEVDIDGAVWRLPGERTKNGEAHDVPLNAEALAILKGLAKDDSKPTDRVFAGPTGGLLSDVAINKVLYAAYPDITAHGIARSSFRDWVAEATSFSDKIAEAALNHRNPNETEAAYLRTKFFDRRIELMRAWGDFVAGKDNVIKLAASA
jgi:integrase